MTVLPRLPRNACTRFSRYELCFRWIAHLSMRVCRYAHVVLQLIHQFTSRIGSTLAYAK